MPKTHILLPLTAPGSAASLAHFSHNARYIAFYPGLPAWLTPGKGWLFWFAVGGVGLPALGLDGLLHHRLGLCSQQTLLAHLTIWAEATTGLVLLLASVVLLADRLANRLAALGLK